MSTDPGGKEWADGAMRQAQVAHGTVLPAEQLDFLPSPEDMQRAHESLAKDTRGSVKQTDVLAEARRAGRKPGSRNRRTEEFSRWLLSHGQHPAVTLMKIQSTPPEILVERSAAMDSTKKRMNYADALSLIARCADILLPYLEGKKPLQVQVGLNGDFNLLIPGLNISDDDARLAAAGGFVVDGDLIQYLPEGALDV